MPLNVTHEATWIQLNKTLVRCFIINNLKIASTAP